MYIYILDYSVGSLNVIHIKEEDMNTCTENIIHKAGFRLSDVEYMVVDNKLNINEIEY